MIEGEYNNPPPSFIPQNASPIQFPFTGNSNTTVSPQFSNNSLLSMKDGIEIGRRP